MQQSESSKIAAAARKLLDESENVMSPYTRGYRTALHNIIYMYDRGILGSLIKLHISMAILGDDMWMEDYDETNNRQIKEMNPKWIKGYQYAMTCIQSIIMYA